MIQRILHQCYNCNILMFDVTKCGGNVDAFCIKQLMQNASIWYISTHFVTKNINAFSIDLIYIEGKSNSKKTKPFSIWVATQCGLIKIAKRLVVLVVFKLNVPVNSYSVMSGRRHRLRFLGGWRLRSLRAFQYNKIGETVCWFKHDLHVVLHGTI